MKHTAKLERFARAFSTNTGGCHRECACGVAFYDKANTYDWEDGELQDLQHDKKAIPLDYPVSGLAFEGKEYVQDCTCWHERATKIMAFITGHDREIAAYLNGEKRAKLAEAAAMPTVEP